MAVIRFRIQTDDTASAADKLTEALTQASLCATARRTQETRQEGERDAALTVAILALIVNLPQGIEATLTLADRAKLLPRIQEFLHAAREKLRGDWPSRIYFERRDGRTVPLDRAVPDDFFDSLDEPEE